MGPIRIIFSQFCNFDCFTALQTFPDPAKTISLSVNKSYDGFADEFAAKFLLLTFGLTRRKFDAKRTQV